MKHPFLHNVSAIRGYPGSRVEVDAAQALDDLKVSGSAVPSGAKASFTGAIEAMDAGMGVVAVGVVRAPWEGDCRRCLGLASGSIEESVREIFEPDATEGETYPLSGDVVDLEPLVRETVVLNLPEAPLCKPDCAGLCPTCGANHNETACDCPTEAADLRWAALDILKADPGN